MGVPAQLGHPPSDMLRGAAGVWALANTQMANAISEITIERGRNVRDHALLVLGGGGPLPGASIARELRVTQVVIPVQPGNFSALGALFANPNLCQVSTQNELLNVSVGPKVSQIAEALRQSFLATCAEGSGL